MAESPHRKRRKMGPFSAQTSPLVGLPQIIIDLMAKHLDLKSLIHLQLTCRGLYAKCLYGQRLKVLEFDRIIVQERDNGERILTVGAEWERLHIQEWQLQATKFRFHANRLVFEDICEPADILKIQECLSGRGTVKKLILGVAAVNLDFNLFNQVLQNLKISQLQVGNLPAEFWQQPSVKQMTHLLCERNFPMSLAYLSETAFEICTIPNGGNDNSCLQLNTVLKKWAEGQKKIKMWNIHVLDVREQQLFKDFLLVAEGDFQPLRRPLVVRATDDFGDHDYTVHRADGEKLHLMHFDGNRLTLSDVPFEEEEDMDSEGLVLDLFVDSDDSSEPEE